MAIKFFERVDRDILVQELALKGWKKGMFNGKMAMFKEFESYLWVAVIEDFPYFLSLPKEESSRVHSEGVRSLIKELKKLPLP